MQPNRTRDFRTDSRVESALRVHFGINACDRSASAENISQEGLFIATNSTYPAGTRLMIQVEFPEAAFFHRAEVIWAIRVPEHMKEDLICGMGVKFIDPDAGWVKFYRNWKTSRLAIA